MIPPLTTVEFYIWSKHPELVQPGELCSISLTRDDAKELTQKLDELDEKERRKLAEDAYENRLSLILWFAYTHHKHLIKEERRHIFKETDLDFYRDELYKLKSSNKEEYAAWHKRTMEFNRPHLREHLRMGWSKAAWFDTYIKPRFPKSKFVLELPFPDKASN